MQKMAVIDLDDTLLSPDKSISPANLRALRTLQEKGFEIIIGSGRHHENIVRFEERIGQQGWVISSNGAVVRHARTSVLLHERTLTLAQALDVCRYAAERDLTVVGYHRHGAFADQNSEWTLRYALGAGWHPRRGNLDELAASGLQKVLLIHSPETIDNIQQEVERRFGTEMYVVRTENEILEVGAHNINKAVGAQAVAKMLGIASQDVVAFGDGNNDVELLAWAGLSVAMSHGRENARKAAKLISPPGSRATAFARAVHALLERISSRDIADASAENVGAL
jgi:Cof subfamily protein (haloacid dehalogenase superfamily)